MKNTKNCSIFLYAVVNTAAVAITVLTDLALRTYKQFAFWDMAMAIYILYISAPIAVSILLYIKILMQRKIPVRYSGLINAILIVIFIIMVNVFYRPLSWPWFVSTYILTAVVFYLQLCSFAYDIFFRKTKS